MPQSIVQAYTLLTLLVLASSTCLILKPRKNHAFPGGLCDNESFIKWVQPIYDQVLNESCTAGVNGKAYKEVTKLYQHLDKLELEKGGLGSGDHFAKTICIGSAPMTCTPDELGFNRCTCIDDGVLYQFVDDVDTCAVKKGGYCAPMYADVLVCQPGTKCENNTCVMKNQSQVLHKQLNRHICLFLLSMFAIIFYLT